jgi:esterase/lipase superfamily enzyme
MAYSGISYLHFCNARLRCSALAIIIAKDNGPKLANFTIGFKEKCQNTDIRLIAHSLGSALVNSTLVDLDTNEDSKTSNNNSKIIKSVQLLGANINKTLIAKNSVLGNAIEHVVDRFYNLYNTEDEGLEFNKKFEQYLSQLNKKFEKHNPLGLIGAQTRTAKL